MGQGREQAEIDFESLAAEDEKHLRDFRITPPDYALLALFGTLFCVVFLQFFTRYVLNDSAAWTEEAARYLLIILAFAGSIRCQAVGSHIVLECVDEYYGRKLIWVHIFALCATLLLFGVIVWSAWELIQRTSFQQMLSLPFPKYYLYVVVMMLAISTIGVAAFQVFIRLKHVRQD